MRRVLYVFLWLFVNLLFKIWFRLRVVDRPRPFPSGPLVIAANHVSFLDPVVLAAAIPRPVTYLVTSTVYYRPLYRPWMWLFGCVPVNDGSVNVEAIKRAVKALRRGEVVGIFPEGGLSPDGRLQPGQIGVATLLRQGGAPVLAAGITGTREALPRGGGFPRPRKIVLRFSESIEPGAVVDGLAPHEARRHLRDRVMAAIERALPENMAPARTPAGDPAKSPAVRD